MIGGLGEKSAGWTPLLEVKERSFELTAMAEVMSLAEQSRVSVSMTKHVQEYAGSPFLVPHSFCSAFPLRIVSYGRNATLGCHGATRSKRVERAVGTNDNLSPGLGSWSPINSVHWTLGPAQSPLPNPMGLLICALPDVLLLSINDHSSKEKPDEIKMAACSCCGNYPTPFA